MECQFCKKILKNSSILENHQKTTKYCLKIQNNIENDKFNCSYCLKNFTTKQHLLTHHTRCKEKYKKDALSNLDSKILELENENQNLENELFLCKEQLNQKNDEIKIYKISCSNDIFENMKVNNKETFKEQINQKRRPRITLSNILTQLNKDNYSIIYDGSILELLD